MECRTPSSEDAYMVQRDNFNVALKFYVDVVIAELRREMQKQGFWIDDLQSLGDGCAAFELHSATICGLHRIILDGWPSPIKVSPDDVGSPERFDISAVVLLRDVYFEGSYDYTSPTQVVSGQVHGKIDTVSLDMIIGHQAGLGVPEVISFKVTKYTGVRLSDRSVGALNEKIIEATGKALNKSMEDAISHHVLPVLNNLLRTIPFPGFT